MKNFFLSLLLFSSSVIIFSCQKEAEGKDDEQANDKEISLGSSWFSNNKSPFLRKHMIFFSINDKGYVGSGANETYGVYNDFWEYDISTDTWNQLSDLPGEPRRSAISFSIKGKGYYGLGYNPLTGERYADIYEFDPSDYSWKRLADFGGGQRIHSFYFTSDTTVFVGGGWDSSTGLVSDLWVYYPTTNEWVPKQEPPFEPRSNSLTFVVDKVPFIIGGGNCCGTYSDFYNEIWQYDILSDSWIEKNKTPFDLAAGITWSSNTYGFLGLGEDENEKYNNHIYRYSPATDSWELYSNLPGKERNNPFVLKYKEFVCIGSGWNKDGTYYSDFWKFTP